jgi:hypothetical protein
MAQLGYDPVKQQFVVIYFATFSGLCCHIIQSVSLLHIFTHRGN